jgi:hypothetical protein
MVVVKSAIETAEPALSKTNLGGLSVALEYGS